MTFSRQFRLFGQPIFQEEGRTLDLTFRKGQALIAYLGATQKRHGRDLLATLLWSEYSQTRARANLRRTIYAINQAGRGGWIEADPDSIRLSDSSPIEIDVIQFNYTEDAVQATAYTTGGQPGYSDIEIAYEDFSTELVESLEYIHDTAPNFRSFTLHGTSDQWPCAMNSSLLYWLKGGDTYYVDWLNGLLAGEETPDVDGEYGFEAR